jgi:hypothetical protein
MKFKAGDIIKSNNRHTISKYVVLGFEKSLYSEEMFYKVVDISGNKGKTHKIYSAIGNALYEKVGCSGSIKLAQLLYNK